MEAKRRTHEEERKERNEKDSGKKSGSIGNEISSGIFLSKDKREKYKPRERDPFIGCQQKDLSSAGGRTVTEGTPQELIRISEE